MAARIAVGCVWLAALACAPAAAIGQIVTGTQHLQTGAGLRMVVDTRWVIGNGYRPVQIEVTPLIAGQADRTLTVEFRSGSVDGSTQVVGRDIEIPAGATSVIATLYVPESTPANSYEFECADDGRYRKSLSFKSIAPLLSWTQGWEESLPAILFLNGAPDTSVLASVLPGTQYYQQYAGWNVTGTPATAPAALQLPSTLGVPATRLPEDWIGLTSLDIVCLSLDESLALAAERPRAWRAIRDWTAAGGNLFMHGLGDNRERLAELEQLLDWKSDASGPQTWTTPEAKHYRRTVDDPNQQASVMSNVTYDANGNVIVSPTPAAPAEVPQQSHFVTRPSGLGMVVAFSGNPFPGTPEQWGWVFNHLGFERYLWTRRHGLSVRGENPDFWNWMIPDVGLAPVNAFRVLITVFVLAIGPLNYYLLWRSGRRQLLLVIVPVCALAITGGLFAYALMADGLGVRARVRSFTALDQRTRQAACWSRISYYAGLTPSGGLTFPADVAVLPLREGALGDGGTTHRQLDWTREGQRMPIGWISSRTLTQYLTIRGRTSNAELRVTADAAGGPPKVENRLGTRMIRLLLVDDGGTPFRGGELAAGASATLEPADPTTDLAAIQKLVQEANPELPEDFQPGYAYGFFGMRAVYAQMYRGADDVTQLSSRLERGIAQSAYLAVDGWRPRTYVAIVERSPEVALGVERVEEKGSLHVIVGEW